MTFPTLEEVKTYLEAQTIVYDDDLVINAMAAEKASQAAVCKVPVLDTDEWPAPLVAAFYRRVARHLKMASVVMGIVLEIDGGMRVSGLDAETRRLEAPYKKVRSFGA